MSATNAHVTVRLRSFLRGHYLGVDNNNNEECFSARCHDLSGDLGELGRHQAKGLLNHPNAAENVLKLRLTHHNLICRCVTFPAKDEAHRKDTKQCVTLKCVNLTPKFINYVSH